MYVHPFNFFHTIYSGYSGLSPSCNSFKCEHLTFRLPLHFTVEWTAITRETAESNHTCTEGLCNTNACFFVGFLSRRQSHCFLKVCFFKSVGRYGSNDNFLKQTTQKQWVTSEPKKLMNRHIQAQEAKSQLLISRGEITIL